MKWGKNSTEELAKEERRILSEKLLSVKYVKLFICSFFIGISIMIFKY